MSRISAEPILDSLAPLTLALFFPALHYCFSCQTPDIFHDILIVKRVDIKRNGQVSGRDSFHGMTVILLEGKLGSVRSGSRFVILN